jgi:VWFA-related protein
MNRMKRFVSLYGVLQVVLCAGLTRAQTPPAADSNATLRATTSEVMLDVVVRDKRGRPVKNLKAGDIEIYEDGARQEIKSFRFAGAREAQQQKTGVATGKQLQLGSSSRPLRAVNLVCIVFHNLDPLSRRQGTEALQEFLKNDLPFETYFGIFNLDDHLTPLYPFTNNRAELMQAAQGGFNLAPLDFSLASEAVLTANPNVVTVLANVNGRSANPVVRITGGEVSRSTIAGAEVSNGEGANRMRGEQATARRDFGNIDGLREEDKITNMINQLGTLPGRKTVLLASTGLVSTGDPDRFRALLNKAGDAGITVYALDTAGLRENSSAHAGSLALDQVASVSRTQTQVTRAGENAPSLAVAKEKSRQGDSMEGAVRASDTQAALRELSEGTGGFLIANTNEYKKPFQRILDDMEAHYEVAYRPTSEKFDGRFRKIEVKTARADLEVESRTGYFALPDLKAGSPSLPFENGALAVLGASPLPRSFDFRASSFQFPGTGGGTQGSLVFEIPGSSLTATPKPERKTHVLHASLLSLVKDASGTVVDKYSVDAPYEVPDANLAGLQGSAVMYTHALSLPPGHYTVETAVLDREGRQASTKVIPFENPEPRKGVDLSSVMLVQRVEAASGQADPADPLLFQGKRLVPLIVPTLSADAKPFVYFVVYPSKANPEKPTLEVEFTVGGQVVAKQTADLPAPDAAGTNPMIVKAIMRPGQCELRITAVQGADRVAKSIKYTVPAQ